MRGGNAARSLAQVPAPVYFRPRLGVCAVWEAARACDGDMRAARRSGLRAHPAAALSRRSCARGTSMTREALKNYATLKNLTFVFALIQIVWLVWFFYTGLGGAQELVARVMSIALILQILFMYQEDYLYKWLPPIANHVIVAVYIGICVYAFVYFSYRIRTHRDLRAGLLHAAGLHRRAADVPAGDGAVAARASRPVLDQRRPGRLHALGLSQPARFLLASRHDVLPRRHLEHGRVLDRHLRPLRPARAHADRGLPAAGRRRQRLRGAARDDQRRAR